MKKLFAICALLATFALAGCNEVTEPITQQTSALTLSFHFNNINEGESMTKTLSNAEIFAEFYAAICDGRLVAPTYNLTFTEVNTGEQYALEGVWNERMEAEIRMGTYHVTGTATAEGEYIQEKCSIVIDDPNVVINSEEATISLNAAYDCALVIFYDEEIASVVNHTGTSEQELFEFPPYIYAFVKDKIWDGTSESYLLGVRHNGSQFTIPTNIQPFTKGKYYVYTASKTSSFESGFILPDMDEGATGVVATIGNYVAVRDITYNEFTLDLEVPSSVKENNHLIKWGATDLYWYNRNKYEFKTSDAYMMLLNDDVYGQFFFDESTTITLNEQNSYVCNEAGELITWLYEPFTPGQPEVVMFGEYAWGESEWGWGYGYYKPMFEQAAWESAGMVDEASYWNGFYAKGIVTLQQPEEMGDHITSVDIIPSEGNNATIRIEVDDEVAILFVALYDETRYVKIMSYLDNNPSYRQWFATSLSGDYEKVSKTFHLKDSAYNGVVEVKLSDYYDALDANTTYVVDIVAAAGDYNGDGLVDGYKQHYETYRFAPSNPDAIPVTIEYFNEKAQVGDGYTYILTGKIVEVTNTDYGNFYIEDETGRTYIYGLLTPDGTPRTQWATAGLKVNDVITVYGTRGEYKGNPQMINAIYVSHDVG